jgi:DNA modification methylase
MATVMNTQSKIYQIFQADCLDPSRYPALVNLFYCDPPFKDYSQIRKENGVNLKPMVKWDLANYAQLAKVASEVLVTGGWFIMKADDLTALESYPLISRFLHFRRFVIWDKGRISTGGNPRVQHELLLFYYKGSKTPFQKQFPPKAPSKWHGNSQGRSYSSIQRCYAKNGGECGSKNDRVHINQTPEDLLRNLIDFFSPPSGLIVDACCGSGSVLRAIKQLNEPRYYWGIDIDAECVALARKEAGVI